MSLLSWDSPHLLGTVPHFLTFLSLGGAVPRNVQVFGGQNYLRGTCSSIGHTEYAAVRVSVTACDWGLVRGLQPGVSLYCHDAYGYKFVLVADCGRRMTPAYAAS